MGPSQEQIQQSLEFQASFRLYHGFFADRFWPWFKGLRSVRTIGSLAVYFWVGSCTSLQATTQKARWKTIGSLISLRRYGAVRAIHFQCIRPKDNWHEISLEQLARFRPNDSEISGNLLLLFSFNKDDSDWFLKDVNVNQSRTASWDWGIIRILNQECVPKD